MITTEELTARREQYPTGTRVRLVQFAVDNTPDAIDDNQTVPPGTEGEVKSVDGSGTVWTHWDNGRNLGFLPEDRVEVIR